MMVGARPSSTLSSLVKTGYAAMLSVNFPVRSTGLAIACGGPAMLPTFESKLGDLLLVDRRPPNWFRGDVVLIRRQDEDFFGGVISTLIALPGDLVRVRGTRGVLEVPEGHCWVEGDNTRESKDSRHYGPVRLDLMEGTVTHIVWPPRRVAVVHGRIPEERVRLLIDPAGSVEEATGLGCLADSIVPHGKRVVRLDSLGSQNEELCRRECNFIYLH